MIYLDNAATSFPKPQQVIRAVNDAMIRYGANPGRSGHNLSVNTASEIYSARETLDGFFNGYGAENVCFFQNCTYALNAAIKGLVRNGDHIVISSLEHNSVVRPVHYLKLNNYADYSVFSVGKTVGETVENFKKTFKNNTRICVVTAVSNVFGNILPIKELAAEAHRLGALLIVDGAQGAGVINIDMKDMGIDCLCIPGHKGLLGPMGTGVLLHRGLDILPVTYGGTGTSSFELTMPDDYPERLEGGTLNVPGICGLKAGVETVKRLAVSNIYKKEKRLSNILFDGLSNIQNTELYSVNYNSDNYAPVVSFNVKNHHSEAVAGMLNDGGFAVRGGYHCAPLAHIFMGTKDRGTVRVSPSFHTSEKDIKNLLNLVRKIAI